MKDGDLWVHEEEVKKHMDSCLMETTTSLQPTTMVLLGPPTAVVDWTKSILGKSLASIGNLGEVC